MQNRPVSASVERGRHKGFPPRPTSEVMRGPLLLLAALLVSAGCLGADAPPENGTPTASEPAPPSLPPFALTGQGCIEGGGHSVHPRTVAGGVFDFASAVPAPWQVADVLEDVGPQLVYSEVPDPMNPVPSEGNTWGNYHATVVCEGWTWNGETRDDLLFGFVGARVEEPPWGDGVPSRNYLVTVVATNDPDVLDALHAAGIHATDATATLALDGAIFDAVLDTAHHGRYESTFVMKELGAMPEAPIRLWFQHENEDGTFTPVALDMVHTPGGAHHGAEGQGYFGHWETDMHGPQGGLGGHTAALAYTDFDRTITLGPRPTIALDEAYEH